MDENKKLKECWRTAGERIHEMMEETPFWVPPPSHLELQTVQMSQFVKEHLSEEEKETELPSWQPSTEQTARWKAMADSMHEAMEHRILGTRSSEGERLHMGGLKFIVEEENQDTPNSTD